MTDRASSLLSLDLHDGTGVLMSCSEYVVQHGQDQHAAKHGRRPVHVWCRHWRGKWPEGEEPQWDQEDDGDDVERHAESSQGPSAWWERFPSESLGQHTPDGDDVRGENGHTAARVDGVEGG